MAVVTLSPAEFNAGLLSALNLSLPTNQARLRRILAKAAAKQQILSQLQQILARKTSPICGTAAEAEAFYPLLCFEAPPGLSLPDGIAPLPELVPPTCLAHLDHSKVGERRTEGFSGNGDSIGSDSEDTSIGDGSGTSVSEETESEGENFEISSNAPCCVASFLSTAPCKAPLPHKAEEMALLRMSL